ncbi:MFS transporter, partial [Actinomadura adrarensis]
APVIVAVGVAGIIGTFLGGRAVDALGPPRALLAFLIGVFAAPAAMVLLGLVGGPYPVLLVGALFVLYGVATWGISPATQAWLLHRAGASSANELIALQNSTMFLGFSVAGGVGGLALKTGGPAAVPVIACGCVAAGLVLFMTAFRRGIGEDES